MSSYCKTPSTLEGYLTMKKRKSLDFYLAFCEKNVLFTCYFGVRLSWPWTGTISHLGPAPHWLQQTEVQTDCTLCQRTLLHFLAVSILTINIQIAAVVMWSSSSRGVLNIVLSDIHLIPRPSWTVSFTVIPPLTTTFMKKWSTLFFVVQVVFCFIRHMLYFALFCFGFAVVDILQGFTVFWWMSLFSLSCGARNWSVQSVAKTTFSVRNQTVFFLVFWMGTSNAFKNVHGFLKA